MSRQSLGITENIATAVCQERSAGRPGLRQAKTGTDAQTSCGANQDEGVQSKETSREMLQGKEVDKQVVQEGRWKMCEGDGDS